jgi:hypothetical protein
MDAVCPCAKAYRDRMKTAIHDAHQLGLALGLRAAHERHEVRQMTTGFASGRLLPYQTHDIRQGTASKTPHPKLTTLDAEKFSAGAWFLRLSPLT